MALFKLPPFSPAWGQACAYRHRAKGRRAAFCAHRAVHARDQLVNAKICAQCTRRAELCDPRPLTPELVHLDPRRAALGDWLAYALHAAGLRKARFAWLAWQLRDLAGLPRRTPRGACDGCTSRQDTLNRWSRRVWKALARLIRSTRDSTHTPPASPASCAE